jgi:VWFA-related protein
MRLLDKIANAFAIVGIAVFLELAGVSQTSGTQAGQGQGAAPGESSPAFTLRSFTRMVNLELVVKDSRGNHIEGLRADDFQLFEQTPSRGRDMHGQKIAEFREVHMAGMAAPASIQTQMAPGVYTNELTAQKDPAPATILLLDGLNTEVQYQAQVHVQMLRMLRQLPSNVPVAVFLLGDRLKMLQSFTTDPKLLQAALSKGTSTANVGMPRMDPRDDPDSAGNLSGSEITPENPAGGSRFDGMVTAIRELDQRIFSATMDERVDRTINALTSLGHNVSGYPGRKNLLWLSTSFPITLTAIGETGAGPGAAMPGSDIWAEFRNNGAQLRHLSAVLSDAKIAVYPVNLAGVQTLQAYRAEARPPDVTPAGISDNISRDILMQAASVDTMQEIADGTGGKICTGDNDLGDCVRKAIDDSSDFYEISYYPNSGDWNGDFRKIIIKTGHQGAHLSYRQGYFASPEGAPDAKAQGAQMKSDCDDYLDATSVPFTARYLPSAMPGELKFSLLIDASALTIPPTADGGHQLNLAVTVCTYNEKDWPLKVMNYPVKVALDAKRYETLTATGELADTISIPAPIPAAIRLLVKDVSTGNLGSVYIKTGDLVAGISKPAEDVRP